MILYAYEDRQLHRHKLTIHISECEQCNAGKGNLDGRDCIFGKWYGPFTSLNDALAGVHHLRQVTEMHECAARASANAESIREEEKAMSRLDDDGGANFVVGRVD